MNYRDTSLTCRQCGKAFSWPGWAQEWRVVTGITALPDYCVTCRFMAARQGIGAGATAPAPPWDGLPMRTVTHGGQSGDPVNLACEGTSEELLAAFAAIGARPAEPLSFRDDLHLAEAALLRGVYMSAPVSRLFLFGRVEDFAIETELGSVALRMHARFWDSGRQDPATGCAVWLGAVSLDSGIELLRRDHIPVGTTHHIDADLDAVRDLLVLTLLEADRVTAAARRPGIGPTADGRNGGGDPFHTDGEVVVMVVGASVSSQGPTITG